MTHVAPARPGEFEPLRIGPLSVWPPVVLAPMAGVTNQPFRTLCREYGAGLYVSEMVTSRAVVERDPKTMGLVSFGADERPRSAQIYGVDPVTVGEAVRVLLDTRGLDHVDLNFGCPVPKITRRGGGSALPWRRGLLRRIIAAAVRAAGPVPVTVKMRTGIDADHLTYRDAGRIAQDEGAAAVALHGRTAAQFYSGTADWDAIGELASTLSIPVLGNGDIWQASDAVAMMRRTGAAGVVVGRGCLGRPWLFADLTRVFAGMPPEPYPTLGRVSAVMRRHAALLAAWRGEDGTSPGVRDFRKHAAWYTKGFPIGGEVRRALGQVGSLAELDARLAGLDPNLEFPPELSGAPRGRTTTPRRVALPEGWLADRGEDDDRPVPADAELAVSGG